MGGRRSLLEPLFKDPVAVAALLDGRLTRDEIATQFECSASTVRRTARRLGMPARKRGRRPAPVLANPDALDALIASGMTATEIGERVGRSKEVVQDWVRRHNLRSARHPQRPPDPPELRDPDWLRREHHDRRRSISEIAKEVGRDPQIVARRFRYFGIPVRPQRTYPELRDAGWLEERFSAGRSAAKIAVELGCTPDAVRKAALRIGVTPRSRRREPLQRPSKARERFGQEVGRR